MWPFKDYTQEIARLRNTVAGMEAHIAAVHLIVEQLFLLTPKEQRAIMVDQLKTFAAAPSHEPSAWITEKQDQRKFNNTLNGILQLFIKRKENP